MSDIIVYFLFLIGTIILLLNISLKTNNFLDIKKVFKDHFNVFTGSKLQFTSIFIVPVLFAIGIAHFRCINNEILESVNLIVSILTAMFFSVLSILATLEYVSPQNNDEAGQASEEKYRKLIKETFNTTIFEIILCLLLLFVSFIVLFVVDFNNMVTDIETLLLKIVSGVIYYLAMVVILNILVVIKRVKTLFDMKYTNSN